ncbi:lytic transglycosylase domain-containing protein [Sphingopyxis sp.]|uniref:lytic transglycosylase domain-containing protein n=1 Tax=Sphingopyxis sp. TaxID=1908224 RepID=UPI0039C97805
MMGERCGCRGNGLGRAKTGADPVSRRLRSPRGRAVALALLAIAASAPVPIVSAPAHAQSAAPSSDKGVARHVGDAARRFGIPEAWIWAVMRVESNGDVRAVSTAGAMGLMQIMPATWANLRARYRLGSDPFDVRDNIMAGAAYLREMHDRYGNATAMLAAYNAGPGRYDEHLSRGRPLPAETRAYLTKLASITGGSDDIQLAAAPPSDPFAWRLAALFAVRSGAASATDNDAADIPPEHPAPDRSTVSMNAVTPPSAGLFVPVSGRSPP